jgi:hypothetical protein
MYRWVVVYYRAIDRHRMLAINKYLHIHRLAINNMSDVFSGENQSQDDAAFMCIIPTALRYIK